MYYVHRYKSDSPCKSMFVHNCFFSHCWLHPSSPVPKRAWKSPCLPVDPPFQVEPVFFRRWNQLQREMDRNLGIPWWNLDETVSVIHMIIWNLDISCYIMIYPIDEYIYIYRIDIPYTSIYVYLSPMIYLSIHLSLYIYIDIDLDEWWPDLMSWRHRIIFKWLWFFSGFQCSEF